MSVCWGLVDPPALLQEAKGALDKMGGKGVDKIQIDTTHFVATSSAGRENPGGGPGVEYQKAQQLSIPVVSPDWVIACAREKRMVPIANYCKQARLPIFRRLKLTASCMLRLYRDYQPRRVHLVRPAGHLYWSDPDCAQLDRHSPRRRGHHSGGGGTRPARARARARLGPANRRGGGRARSAPG